MLNFYLVAINELTTEVTVYLMKVQTMVTSKQSLYKLNVLTHLVDGACAAGVVTGGLDAAGESLVALEADNIVGLPAVQ